MSSELSNLEAFTYIISSIFIFTYAIYQLKSSKSNQKHTFSSHQTPEKEKIINDYMSFLHNENSQVLSRQIFKHDNQIKNILSIPKDINKDNLPYISIVYATQNNTSKQFSLSIKSDFKDSQVKVKIINTSEFTIDLMKKNVLIIFLISTYGEGEPTDDSLDFFKEIDSQIKEMVKSDIDSNPYFRYAIFGLGSKKYEKYCESAKRLEKVLLKNRLQPVFRTCFGDDSENMIRKDFDAWKIEAYRSIIEYLIELEYRKDKEYELFKERSMIYGRNIDDEDEDYEISLLNETTKNEKDNKPITTQDYDYQIRSFLSSTESELISIKQLRLSTEQGSTLQLILNTKGNLSYNHGDNIGLFPINSDTDVYFLIKRLDLNPEARVSIKKRNEKLKKRLNLINNITIKEALTNNIDLKGRVTINTLKSLLKFTFDEKEYSKLLNLINNPQSFSIFDSYNLNIIDILILFPSIKPGFIEFYSICSRPCQRYYTVVSSPKTNSSLVEICISLVSHKTVTGLNDIEGSQRHVQERFGYVSNILNEYYNNYQSNIKFRLTVKESGFKLPSNSKSSLIMIGTGTGLAPFISFMRELKETKTRRDCLLFFGTKTRNDFIYEDEVNGYVREGMITRVFVSFSRESNKKEYVQVRIIEEKELIRKYIETKQGNIYICGGVNMGGDVMKVLEELIGENSVKALENEKRIFKELY